MSLVTRMLEAAARMARPGSSPDFERHLRDALKPLNGAAWGTPRTNGPLEACFGAPAAFTDALATRLRSGRQGSSAAASGAMETRVHAEAYGSRTYKLFVPRRDRPPAGLVVMLHGCTQTADGFADGTRMNALARDADVAVAYPEQVRSANASLCWNWFESRHQERDAGEPGILAGLARAVATELRVPPSRVFAAGLSAGAAMAAILAETDPDLFAAVGLHSGLPFGAAHDVSSAFAAMRGPVARGAGRGGDAGAPPVPAVVFQGDADRTVHPGNAEAIVARLAARQPGLTTTVERGAVPGGRSYVRELGRTAAGAAAFERWTVAGAGHAWSGGSPAGSYTDPSGPDASAAMLRFFLDRP